MNERIRVLMSELVRKDTLDGRPHLVVPTILVTEGVHNGELYPSDELAKYPQSWDGRPVVLDHPESRGRPISANAKDVLEKRKVGLVLNSKYDEWTVDGQKRNGIKSEVWLDIEKCETSDEGTRVLTALDDGENIEVSTGLFTDDEDKKGEWNGEKYDAIVVNFRPDHLAILPPGKKGACSWDDGAGMPRVNADKGGEPGLFRRWVNRLLGLRDNAEVSHNDLSSQLHNALNGRKGMDAVPVSPAGAYVVDIFDDHFVFERGGKLFKTSYTVDDEDGTITIGDDETEVRRKVTYQPIKTNAGRLPDGAVLVREDDVSITFVDHEGNRRTLSALAELPDEDEIKELLPDGATVVRYGTTSIVYVDSDGTKKTMKYKRTDEGLVAA